jgi:hypothetical protein
MQMPAGKVHYPQGTPVEMDDQGMMFPFIADKLREPDPQRDQLGRAAVVLDRGADPAGRTREGFATSRVPVPALRAGRRHRDTRRRADVRQVGQRGGHFAVPRRTVVADARQSARATSCRSCILASAFYLLCSQVPCSRCSV